MSCGLWVVGEYKVGVEASEEAVIVTQVRRSRRNGETCWS